MCDFTKNYYIYSSCMDPGAHFFRTSVDGNRKLACPKGPHERLAGDRGTRAGPNSGQEEEIRYGMMGTQQSTAASQQEGGGGKALAWSAEVTWSDDNNSNNTGRGERQVAAAAAGDGEWCTCPLDSAPDAGGSKGGGGVILAWSWASSWR